MANFRMMPVVVAESFANSNVGGLIFRLKRSDASATSPSQCPEMRAWFTMRAHAAASAVALQGVVTPSTHASAPNISNRSLAASSTFDAEAGKLGNE